ncbi:hypothetical protein GGQ88_003705 [Novosphingobium hassiacum]|uniref:Uncharacterized protein n=1 Tax=Novosphingobium hassiacum TaxID=173676 RepID=A0A7W5ZYK0_9SPHN|nr:hypothetical protein [Novosphingobium hassiacum]MBB3862405.1 hypothetical protein [Novosphingobium hassiacum]
MTDPIFAFKGEGVAERVINRRKGARHAMMIFVQSDNLMAAEARAYQIAKDNGWSFIVLQKGGEVKIQPSEIDEPYLRAALNDALQIGTATIIYKAELPSNA